MCYRQKGEWPSLRACAICRKKWPTCSPQATRAAPGPWATCTSSRASLKASSSSTRARRARWSPPLLSRRLGRTRARGAATLLRPARRTRSTLSTSHGPSTRPSSRGARTSPSQPPPSTPPPSVPPPRPSAGGQQQELLHAPAARARHAGLGSTIRKGQEQLRTTSRSSCRS